MPPRPERPADSYWHRASTTGLVLLLLGGGWLIFLLARDEDGFLQIVDSFNLVIHEFGHPFFGTFGEEPMWWGGTWMELLVPAIIAGVFWYQRSALSFAFAGVWFFENFHYIATYMADARAQELPLVGGGEHDWATILGKHGLLEQDTQIAGWVNTIGYIGMVTCLAFAVIVWYSQREARAADKAKFEADFAATQAQTAARDHYEQRGAPPQMSQAQEAAMRQQAAAGGQVTPRSPNG